MAMMLRDSIHDVPAIPRTSIEAQVCTPFLKWPWSPRRGLDIGQASCSSHHRPREQLEIAATFCLPTATTYRCGRSTGSTNDGIPRMLVANVLEGWTFDIVEEQPFYGPCAVIVEHEQPPYCESAARRCFACIFCKSTHTVHQPFEEAGLHRDGGKLVTGPEVNAWSAVCREWAVGRMAYEECSREPARCEIVQVLT